MTRDPRLYLQEIQDRAAKVLQYGQGLTRESFAAHGMAYDAVLRNLEIIGAAAERLPKEIKDLAPEVPWRMICGFRDRLAHAFSAPGDDKVWEVVTMEVPALLLQVARILRSVSGQPPFG